MKKQYIQFGLFALLFLYVGAVIYAIFFSPRPTYLYVGETLLLEKKGNTWKPSSLTSIDEMELYREKEKIGTYQVKKEGNEFYLYEKNELVSEDLELLLGYRGDVKIEIPFYQIKETNVFPHFEEILKNNSINDYSFLSSNESLNFDFDNDGVSETIYAVSNTFVEDEYDKVFSIVYYIKNGTYHILYQTVDQSENMNQIPRPYFHSVVTIDGKTYFILVLRKFDQGGATYQFYEWKDEPTLSLEFTTE